MAGFDRGVGVYNNEWVMLVKTMNKKPSPSEGLPSIVIFWVMNLLKNEGGEMSISDIHQRLGEDINSGKLDKEFEELGLEREYALKIVSAGVIRAARSMSYRSVNCVKAGYLIKKERKWSITSEGLEAIKKGRDNFFEDINNKYEDWKNNKKNIIEQVDDKEEENGGEDSAKNYIADEESIDNIAIESIKREIRKLNPYEFQDLVAALLRGMGYYTPFVAPKGRDGGVDIIAYQDPLGVQSPRIKVQVKHQKDTKMDPKTIRELHGVLKDDIGIFVSSGGFTSDAKKEKFEKHLELIDLDRFISLWQDIYSKLNDEDKSLLRIKYIYFYDSSNY